MIDDEDGELSDDEFFSQARQEQATAEPFDFAKCLEELKARPILSRCERCNAGMHEVRTLCYECEETDQQNRMVRRQALASVRDTVGDRYHWARFSAPELTDRVKDAKAIATVREAALTFDRLILQGPAGVGKTVLAVCVLFARANDRFLCHFTDSYTLANARQRSPLGEEADAVWEAMTAEVCVIDDLGSEPNVPTSALVEVIHLRHAEARPTVVTTWMTRQEITARYGGGVCRRLFEGAVVVDMTKPKGAR